MCISAHCTTILCRQNQHPAYQPQTVPHHPVLTLDSAINHLDDRNCQVGIVLLDRMAAV